MKGFIIIFAAAILFSCNNNPQDSSDVTDHKISSTEQVENVGRDSVTIDNNAPTITLQEDTYEFGIVKEGEKVEHEFEFINGGKTPLIISNVSASCGCTTPEYTKSPVKPGDSGRIKVVFDSKGQVGVQHKIITIQSNAQPATTLLHLKGEVK